MKKVFRSRILSGITLVLDIIDELQEYEQEILRFQLKNVFFFLLF